MDTKTYPNLLQGQKSQSEIDTLVKTSNSKFFFSIFNQIPNYELQKEIIYNLKNLSILSTIALGNSVMITRGAAIKRIIRLKDQPTIRRLKNKGDFLVKYYLKNL